MLYKKSHTQALFYPSFYTLQSNAFYDFDWATFNISIKSVTKFCIFLFLGARRSKQLLLTHLLKQNIVPLLPQFVNFNGCYSFSMISKFHVFVHHSSNVIDSLRVTLLSMLVFINILNTLRLTIIRLLPITNVVQLAYLLTKPLEPQPFSC